MIVGTHRTGCSALVHALNVHPDIACGPQWTQRLFPRQALRVAERSLARDLSPLKSKHRKQMDARLSDSKTILGFKRLFRASIKWLFTPAFGPMIIDGLKAHIRWLDERQDIRVIQIAHNNHLAWIQSKAFADATGKYSGAAYLENMEV